MNEKQIARAEMRRALERKLRHMLLCKGVPPESVDDRLGWEPGRTRAIVRGWPAAPRRRLKRKWRHRFVSDVTLDRISDIGAACGCDLRIRIEPA